MDDRAVSRELFNELYEDYDEAMRKIAKMSECTTEGAAIEIMDIVDDIIHVHRQSMEVILAKAKS